MAPGGSSFDDARDSDAAQLWLGLAGVGAEEDAAAEEQAAEESGADPAAPELSTLLTRASDLPAPAPVAGAGGPVPLPWTSAEPPAQGGGKGGRGGKGERGGKGGSGGKSGRGATTRGDRTERARGRGRGGRREEAEGSDPRPRRRPGPAPLPEDPGAREEAAREVVLRQLAMGPRSRGQLERKLAEREAEPELIARVLDRFEEVRLVDDAAFAEVWVRSRHRSRGLSRRAIGRELQEKGVDRELAAEALEAIEPEDERAAALELARRRLRGRQVPSSATPVDRAERDKVVRRLVGMLGRRGYGPGLAFGVVKEALAELEE